MQFIATILTDWLFPISAFWYYVFNTNVLNKYTIETFLLSPRESTFSYTAKHSLSLQIVRFCSPNKKATKGYSLNVWNGQCMKTVDLFHWF